MSQDIYTDLKNAPIEDLIGSIRMAYASSESETFFRGVELGVKLAGKDGWEHVAPAWLREYLAGNKGNL